MTLLVIFTSSLFAQYTKADIPWNQPFEPFRIAGNIYYVGANEVTSYLITTPKGHILLDSGFAETVPQILSNIEKLGFKFTDVKFIINSHAHYDHAGGIAELKRRTNAKLVVSRGDAKLMARGGTDDPNFGDRFPFEPAVADSTFTDGWKLKLGGTSLTANVTSGHTKGCTTWTTVVKEGTAKLNTVFVCSTSAPGYKLVANEKYPEIAADYETTFRRMKAMKIDIFLSSHASAFNIAEKAAEAKRGGRVNPFIDPAGYKAYLESTEASFKKTLELQRPK